MISFGVSQGLFIELLIGKVICFIYSEVDFEFRFALLVLLYWTVWSWFNHLLLFGVGWFMSSKVIQVTSCYWSPSGGCPLPCLHNCQFQLLKYHLINQSWQNLILSVYMYRGINFMNLSFIFFCILSHFRTKSTSED